MMRVTGKVLDNLKTLKGIIGNAPYSDIIHELVHKRLLEDAAYTKNGYLPVGTVVRDMEGTTLVIKSISDGKVIFNDYSYVLNGGGDCWNLDKLSNTVAGYKSTGETAYLLSSVSNANRLKESIEEINS